MAEPQTFFTAREAAAHIRYSVATLAIWRSDGRGPIYSKIGSTVRYRRGDLEGWLTASELDRARIEAESDCHRMRRAIAKRARGRAGMAQRERRLKAEPFCRDCAEYGIQRLADEIDHITPLSAGGQDADDNVRSLCRVCHSARTRATRGSA